MKNIRFVFFFSFCIALQCAYAQNAKKRSQPKPQLSQNGFKPKPKYGTKEWLQQKRKGNVVFASDINYKGIYKARPTGTHDKSSLGFLPKSIYVSNTGRYLIIKFKHRFDTIDGQTPPMSTLVIREDVPDLNSYDRYQEMISEQTILQGETRFQIMQY